MNAATKHLVGILGGMGPAATADFYAQLVRCTPASRDQEHLRVVIWADPSVPDRIGSVLGHGPDVYPSLLVGAQRLLDLGATIGAMPCNTAHFYLKRLTAATGLPFADMIAETISAITDHPNRPETVGVIGTRGVLQSGLFQQGLLTAGIRPVEPDLDAQQDVNRAIHNVKAGNLSSARVLVEHASRRLASAGADIVVLACSELPLAMRNSDCSNLPALVDPTTILAQAVVRECLGVKPEHALPWSATYV